MLSWLRQNKRILGYVFFVALLFVWFTVWALIIPFGGFSGGPDEPMRLLIPQYIYAHQSLPTGCETEVIYGLYYWSYAFYPQFLGSILSAIFMGAMSFVYNTPESLLVAARMTSVLSALGVVIVIGATVAKIFEKHKRKTLYMYVAMILTGLWPQLAFLAGYVNNDVVALFGVSLIVYACLLGLKDTWSYKSSLLLSVGFVVCLLGYVNSYGFVLFGGLFFIYSLVIQRTQLAKGLRFVAFVALLTALVAGPFFLRNAVLYEGDVFGISTFKARTIQGEQEQGARIQHNYTEYTGKSSLRIMIDKEYFTTQKESFIARFGAMDIKPGKEQLIIYQLFIVLAVVGLLGALYSRWRKNDVKRHRQSFFYALFLILSMVTTVLLSLYYTVATDYQPQGRYIIYLLVPLMTFGFYGFVYLLNLVTVRRFRKSILIIFTVLYALNTILLFRHYILPLS